jgi:hypothetical protein
MPHPQRYPLDQYSVQGENLNLLYDYNTELDKDYILIMTSRGLQKFTLMTKHSDKM